MSDGNTELRRLLARSRTKAGMVIDGVEHRPSPGYGRWYVCLTCDNSWPCSAVKVEALKAAVVKVRLELWLANLEESNRRIIAEADLARRNETLAAVSRTMQEHMSERREREGRIQELEAEVSSCVYERIGLVDDKRQNEKRIAELEAENAAMLDKARDYEAENAECVEKMMEYARQKAFGHLPSPTPKPWGLYPAVTSLSDEDQLRQRNEEYLRTQRAGRLSFVLSEEQPTPEVVGAEQRQASTCDHGTVVTGTMAAGRSTTWCPRCGMVYSATEGG